MLKKINLYMIHWEKMSIFSKLKNNTTEFTYSRCLTHNLRFLTHYQANLN